MAHSADRKSSVSALLPKNLHAAALVLNGTIVETYSDFQEIDTVTWVHVFVTVNGNRIEGWLLESVVAYATPAPNFEASATPTFGVTPSP